MPALAIAILASASAAIAAGAGALAPPSPPIAKSYGEVVKTTLSNFLSIGGIGFAWTANSQWNEMKFINAQYYSKVAGTAKDAVPRFVVQRAVMQGQKWGRLSAGFAGGRAFGQVWQGEDNFQAAMCGAVAGGVFAATSLADIPSSVGTFVMFSYFIEKLTANSKAQAQGSGGTPRAARPAVREPPSRAAVGSGARPEGAGGLTPGQRLDRLLGISS